ncbi:Peroxisomal acyl-coenzyme A oxidase [Penicillium chrysogenum]|uniref:Peroxisomal acyl-coenzyme A oxidase n=1 Tax=Penicillium chrysogenum TaxID=5076 RepID=A0A161XT71_PENCH|nr:Peroxisomal acyl-coenzyme A oxidase [Penicillium chrysogenum]
MQVPTESSLPLLSTPLFQSKGYEAASYETLERSYYRAREIGRHHGLTIDDILSLTPKFWKSHMDAIIIRDIVAHILFSIQYNLVAGTIAPYTLKRPDLRPVMEKILNFDVSACFMLNEVDHGCDAKNLETTATLQSDGSFVLHSLTPGAAKFMPPSMPIAGMPRIALVFARLMIEGDDRGIRPFIVGLGDGKEMCTGVTTTLLPPIACGRTLDHSITSFNKVRLPSTAMLGSHRKPDDMRTQFLMAINRLGFGTLSLSLSAIPGLKCAVLIAGKYNLRRMVHGPEGSPKPIISFRTQQLPILHALAESAVVEPHGLAVIFKGAVLQYTQKSFANLVERCGAQGVFIHNQLVEMEALNRCNGIAEGLATEILIGRYEIPNAIKPNSLIAKHEEGYIAGLKKLLGTIEEGHRSEAYNSRMLPHCRSLILAIGHRMAYEAAVHMGVDPDLLALFEAGVIKTDSSWYVENLGLSRADQFEMESKAADALVPRVGELLNGLGTVEPYITAPILSAERWETFVAGCETIEGDASCDIIDKEDMRAKL